MRPWWDSSEVGVGEEADTMTPDTRAPYKEIIHDVLATNYSVSRNEAPLEDADTDAEKLSSAQQTPKTHTCTPTNVYLQMYFLTRIYK